MPVSGSAARRRDDFNAADDETQQPNDMAGFEQIIRFLQNNLVNSAVGTSRRLTSSDSIRRLTARSSRRTQILERNLLNLRGLPVADNTARGQTIPVRHLF